MDYLTTNFNELAEELKNRASEEGVAGQSAYNDLIEQIISEKLEFGELSGSSNLDALKEKLENTWLDFDRSRR